MNAQERWAALPEGQRAEIVNGELVLQPNPGIAHIEVAGALAFELRSRYERALNGPGGWVFLAEPNVRIGSDIYEPDIAGWRRERYDAVTAEQVVVEVVPDWVCEVLSPSTKTRDRSEKLPNYFRNGVDYVWLVAPRDRLVEVYARGVDHPVTVADLENVIALPPFTEAGLDMSWVWRGR